MYVWISENGTEELKRHPKRGFSFSRQKGDSLKKKRKVSPFSLLLPVYLPFIAVLYLFWPVCMARKRPKHLVKST